MQWQAKGNHTGVFDGYTVIGIKFENDAGAIGWKITPCRTGVDPNHDYWVAGENFYSFSIHYQYQRTAINLREIHDPPITESIDAAERKAVLKAIAEWETSGSPI